MTELIIFPDAEDAVRRHLDASITDAEVFAAATPAQLPERSVTVVRVGGTSDQMVIDRPSLSIDCRSARTRGDAFRLANQVRAIINAAALDGAMSDATCYWATETSGPYLNPDPLNHNQHRYTIAFQMGLRGN